ncbi:MAG: hypothetical protein V1727_02210 [Candidatus Omnitrophota bacterium]
MRVRILEKIDREQWDVRARSVPDATIFQTTIMADLVEKIRGMKALYLVAEDALGNICAQLLFFEGISGLIYQNDLSLLHRIYKRFHKNIFWHYGPLIFERDQYIPILSEIVRSIDEYAQKNAVHKIGEILPPVHDYGLDQEQIREVFEQHGFSARKSATVLIELHKGKEALWNELKKSSRYDVSKAQRDGVEVVELMSKDEIAGFHRVRVESAIRNATFIPRPKDIAVEIDVNPKRKIMLAKIKGRVIAGYILRYFNGIVQQCALANSEYARKKNIFAMHLLTWAGIQWGCEEGFRFFDFMGVNPLSEKRTPKEYGIYRFKTRWGGRELRYYSYTKAFPRRLRSLISVATRIKW